MKHLNNCSPHSKVWLKFTTPASAPICLCSAWQQDIGIRVQQSPRYQMSVCRILTSDGATSISLDFLEDLWYYSSKKIENSLVQEKTFKVTSNVSFIAIKCLIAFIYDWKSSFLSINWSHSWTQVEKVLTIEFIKHLQPSCTKQLLFFKTYHIFKRESRFSRHELVWIALNSWALAPVVE